MPIDFDNIYRDIYERLMERIMAQQLVREYHYALSLSDFNKINGIGDPNFGNHDFNNLYPTKTAAPVVDKIIYGMNVKKLAHKTERKIKKRKPRWIGNKMCY